jgi:hypothetical protein
VRQVTTLPCSEFFWQPGADDEHVPMTMAAVWLMFKAPRLLEAPSGRAVLPIMQSSGDRKRSLSPNQNKGEGDGTGNHSAYHQGR